MRKTLLSLSLSPLVVVVLAAAGLAAAPSSSLTVNPLGAAIKEQPMAISYERSLGNRRAIEIAAMAVRTGGVLDLTGYGAMFGVRFYLDGSFAGLYLEPAVAATVVKLGDQDISAQATTVSAAAFVGCKFIISSGLTLDIRAGPAYSRTQAKTTFMGSEGSDRLDKTGAVASVGLGFSW